MHSFFNVTSTLAQVWRAAHIALHPIPHALMMWLFWFSSILPCTSCCPPSKNQLADILTKGNFTRDEWNHLLCLFNIRHFSSTNCSEVMSKRMQKDAGEERVTAKSKPMMNLVSRCSERNPDVLASTASESPVKTRYQSQIPLSSWTDQPLRTGDPWRTLAHQATQNGILTRNGLLKSGNLMSAGSKNGEGDLLMNNHPVCSHSTRADLLLMTMIWTLAPLQNQTCR